MQSQSLKDNSKLSKSELAILVLSATVTITLVSASSPLYPYNPWDDANCFFTLGRGIIHGYVPYRDLYEQKGPLLYFIYALAALISEKSFIGSWIAECISASLFAVFSWKTTKLFIDPSKYAIAVMPLFLGLVYTTGMFNFGGNAEELCFPLLTIALYFGFKAIIKGDGLPANKEAMFIGLFTGIVFWIKYTFIGFFAGFCLYILVLTVKRKSFLRLWSLVWRYVAGFLVISIPILIYFAANKAIGSLWEAYFYNNMFLYHSGVKATGLAAIPVVKNIYIPLISIASLAKEYPSYGIMLVFSLISLMFTGKNHRQKTIGLFLITFALSLGVVFTRMVLIYYYGYILAYGFCLVLIPVVKLLNYIEKVSKRNPSFIKGFAAFGLLVIYIFTIIADKNMYLMFKPKDYLAQYRMADTINQTPDAKILTYDVMDAGFYTAAGLMPVNRFYCYLNIELTYPAILEEQNRLIEEGYYDYIITTYFCKAEWDNYELIQEETVFCIDYTGEGFLEGFKLYKKI